MNNTVDGEYQNFKAKGGAYTRKHFFGKHPDALKLVENMTDDEIEELNRGGHDPGKFIMHISLHMTAKINQLSFLLLQLKAMGLVHGKLTIQLTRLKN